MSKQLYGLQRHGQWLAAPAELAQFGVEPIWAAPTIDEALQKATLLRFTHALSVEPRRIP